MLKEYVFAILMTFIVSPEQETAVNYYTYTFDSKERCEEFYNMILPQYHQQADAQITAELTASLSCTKVEDWVNTLSNILPPVDGSTDGGTREHM